MIFESHIPGRPLNRYIESMLYFSGVEAAHAMERLLPDGNVTLILEFTGAPCPIYDNLSLSEIQQCKKAWFSGFRTLPITIPSGRERAMLVVNFHKGGAWPFLTEPLHAMTNHVVEAELVFGKELLSLREQIQETIMISEKFALIESWLLRCYDSRLQPSPVVTYLVGEFSGNAPYRNCRELVSTTGYTQKHLLHLFKKQVGVTLKEFSKVMRFQQAIRQLDGQMEADWIGIALSCGYYDQSHFISDFRSYSGYTPTEYWQRRGELMNYVPIPA